MLSEISGLGILIIVIAIAIGIAIPVWAVVDAAMKPSAAFAAAGPSKTKWIVLIALFTVFIGVIGFCLSVYYLIAVRPKVGARV